MKILSKAEGEHGLLELDSSSPQTVKGTVYFDGAYFNNVPFAKVGEQSVQLTTFNDLSVTTNTKEGTHIATLTWGLIEYKLYAPSCDLTNYMTLNTVQTITGTKTFSNPAFRGQLVIERSESNNDSVIAFRNNRGLLGCLGYRGADGVACVWDGDTDTGVPIATQTWVEGYLTGGKNASDFRNGFLVRTTVKTASNTMLNFSIIGNSYNNSVSYTRKSFQIHGQFYCYTTYDNILQIGAVSLGDELGDIKVFCYDDGSGDTATNKVVCLWFQQTASFQSFSVSVFKTISGTYPSNVVASITNAEMPTSGVTRLKTITPYQVFFNSGGTIDGNLTAKGSLTVNGSITTSSKLTINNGASLEVQGNAFIGGTLYAGLSTNNPYATQSWVEGKGYATTTQLANYLPLSGGIMTGDLTIGKNASIKVTDSIGSSHYAFQLNSANSLLIGQYTARQGYETLIYGNKISLCYGSYGSSSHTALFVNSSGNVGIGTTSPTSKLHVEGTANISSSLTIGGDTFGNGWSVEGGIAYFGELNATDIYADSVTVGDTSVASKSYTIPAVSAKRWVRIAEMTNYVSCGTITISKNYNSIPTQHAVFHVQSGYVQSDGIKAEYNITQLACTCNTDSDQYFTRVRIVYANPTTSTSKAYVEVYCNFVTAETLKVSLSGCTNMSLLSAYTLGSVPTGYDYRSIYLQPGGARNECYQMIDLTPYHLGTKNTYSELPAETSATPPSVGDIWIVAEAYNGNPANTKWKWNGSTWVALASNTFTYSPDTFYPVVGSKLSASGGFTRIEVRNNLNNELENNVPSWSTHTRGFTANMVVYARGSEYGVNVGQAFCVDYNYLYTDKNPVGYSQMTNASLPVLWLRGGGKYNVYTDRLMRWDIKTSAFTSSSQSVSPQSGGAAIFSFTKANLYANIVGYVNSSNANTFTAKQSFTAEIEVSKTDMVAPITIKGAGNKSFVKFTSGTTNLGFLGFNGVNAPAWMPNDATEYIPLASQSWVNTKAEQVGVTANGTYITFGDEDTSIFASGTIVMRGEVQLGSTYRYGFTETGDGNLLSLTAQTVTQTSDLTRKNILEDVLFTVEDIAAAPFVKFQWNDRPNDLDVNVGSIAQYWKNILPEAIHGKVGENLSMEYQTIALGSSIITAREVVKLKEEIKSLKEKIVELEKSKE